MDVPNGDNDHSSPPPRRELGLSRELGLFGATMLGLGSIVGTGVFVSIGIAAGIAGPGVLVAVAVAAAVATCNALSSAQLAASHPVSGGTYEYGYRYLRPWLGYSAGWMFLCTKTASAATAALGFSGYFLNAMELDADWMIPLALATVAIFTLIVLAGVRLSSRVNIAVVSITLLALIAFVIAGLPAVTQANLELDLAPLPLLEASALMFVAYAGYGRIATLGEEVVNPERNIPRAILLMLFISMVLYLSVTFVAVGASGAEALSAATLQQAAPLEIVAREFPLRVHGLVAVGAMTAMLGVLLNLLLGVSRVVLAMGRRGDLPHNASKLPLAVLATGVTIAALVLTGSVKTTWSFSAFTVLVYYAITNLAALRLASESRLYHPGWAWGGLTACLLLAFSIEWQVWLSGLGLLALGLAWHWWQSSYRK